MSEAGDSKISAYDYSKNDDTTQGYHEESFEKRERWANVWGFIAAAVGSAVGLGNIWRFPYLVYLYGGGPFLIPFTLLLFIIGFPILSFEVSVGQVYQGGATKCLGIINSKLRGLGVAMTLSQFVIGAYYNLVLAWAMIYLGWSFINPLPWSPTNEELQQCPLITDEMACGDLSFCQWNADAGICIEDFVGKASDFFYTQCNIGANPTWNVFGWWIMICMFIMWGLVFLALSWGAKIFGYIMMVMIALPAVLLITIMIVGATLPGAGAGVRVFIADWNWSELGDPTIWVSAASQVIFTLSVCGGIMQAYSSYNKRTANCTLNTYLIPLFDYLFSLVAGFAVFTVLGYLSNRTGVPVRSVVASGTSLAFQTYPVGLANLPYPGGQILCVLFFFTLFILGMDTSVSFVEVNITMLKDSTKFKNWKRIYVALGICIAGFLCSILFCFENGSFILDMLDWIVNEVSLIFFGFMEATVVGWFFGFNAGAKKVGRKAMLCYSSTYFLSLLIAFLVGVFGIWYAGIIVFVVLFAVGFGLSIWLMNEEDCHGHPTTLNDRLFWMCYGVTDQYRKHINQVTNINDSKIWKFTPMFTVLNKYIVPGVMMYFLVIQHQQIGINVLLYPYGEGYLMPNWLQFVGFIIAYGLVLLAIVQLTEPVTAYFKAVTEEASRESIAEEWEHNVLMQEHSTISK